ncbi:uncharacterized protein B0H18DRAFT_959754 [Fomitopsis serialis]|uniref:uncharacterized protein n=1 Tax=Fomitopsis serialis TaxID=139415 RepID=UPI002007BAE6|nr:uncharacterized protein B0H18DRAFT_959754 [Neoantrodia serialis]KAH9914536.1 hypothetical protein B0H18DRAFT_959754 [Neoantrodia serialis]
MYSPSLVLPLAAVRLLIFRLCITQVFPAQTAYSVPVLASVYISPHRTLASFTNDALDEAKILHMVPSFCSPSRNGQKNRGWVVLVIQVDNIRFPCALSCANAGSFLDAEIGMELAVVHTGAPAKGLKEQVRVHTQDTVARLPSFTHGLILFSEPASLARPPACFMLVHTMLALAHDARSFHARCRQARHPHSPALLVVTSLRHRTEPSVPWYDPTVGHLRTLGGPVLDVAERTVRNTDASARRHDDGRVHVTIPELAEFKNFRLPDNATCTNTTKQMPWLSALSWGEGPRNTSSGAQYGNW